MEAPGSHEKRKRPRKASRAAMAALAGFTASQSLTERSVAETLTFPGQETTIAFNSGVRSENRAERIRNDALTEEARTLQEGLRPKGEWYEKLHDPNLTAVELGALMNHISSVVGKLTAAYMNRKVPDALRKEMVPRNYSALKALTIPEVSKGMIRRCNGAYFAFNGRTYLGTNQHCVKGSAVERHYFFENGGPDLALTEVQAPANVQPFTMSDTVSDVNLSGRLITFTSQNKFAQTEEFVSVMVPVTEPMMRILFERNGAVWNRESGLIGRYWFVMPPHHGDSHTGKAADVHALGESGTFLPTYDEATGKHVIAGVMHSILPRINHCENNYQNTCVTIGFADPPSLVRRLLKHNEEKHPESKFNTRIVYKTSEGKS